MDQAVARADAGQVPRERDRVSARNGGAWEVRKSVPRVRSESAAHSLCGQRNELLCALPNRRQAAGRSLALPLAEKRLAQNARGIRGDEKPVTRCKYVILGAGPSG